MILTLNNSGTRVYSKILIYYVVYNLIYKPFTVHRSDQEKYLTNETRNNVQLLINKLFELPVKNEDGYMYVDLPEPRYNLPREKPLPTPKPLTKWQKFAIEKGIKKTPKPKATWDEILQVLINFYK